MLDNNLYDPLPWALLFFVECSVLASSTKTLQVIMFVSIKKMKVEISWFWRQ